MVPITSRQSPASHRSCSGMIRAPANVSENVFKPPTSSRSVLTHRAAPPSVVRAVYSSTSAKRCHPTARVLFYSYVGHWRHSVHTSTLITDTRCESGNSSSPRVSGLTGIGRCLRRPVRNTPLNLRCRHRLCRKRPDPWQKQASNAKVRRKGVSGGNVNETCL